MVLEVYNGGMSPCAGHTSRFLVIWLSFLPLALFPAWGWSTVPVTTMIAFLLLGIEEISVRLEEPFAILPLGTRLSLFSANLQTRNFQLLESLISSGGAWVNSLLDDHHELSTSSTANLQAQ